MKLTLFNLIFFVVLVGASVITGGQPLLAQDAIESGQKALSNANFPWYDADKDSLQSMDLPDDTEANSKDRNDVSLHQKKAGGGGAGGGPSDLTSLSFLAWGLIAIFITLVILALVWAFLQMEDKTTKDGEQVEQRSMEERIKELPFDLQKSSGDFQQLAHQAYQSGDYKTAITLLFSHVLLTLDKASLIRLRKGKTNRQYLTELYRHRELKGYYEKVMVPFEDAFFGDHDLRRENFEACWQDLNHFENNVAQATQVVA